MHSGRAQAELVRARDRLAAGWCGELAQHCRDMVLRGAWGDDEAISDLRVGQAFPEQREHLELTPGEACAVRAGLRSRAAGDAGSDCAELLRHAPLERRRTQVLRNGYRLEQRVLDAREGEHQRTVIWPSRVAELVRGGAPVPAQHR